MKECAFKLTNVPTAYLACYDIDNLENIVSDSERITLSYFCVPCVLRH